MKIKFFQTFAMHLFYGNLRLAQLWKWNVLGEFLKLFGTQQRAWLVITVRVKGGMSLRNGMWHGLRNHIIMRNVIYAE